MKPETIASHYQEAFDFIYDRKRRQVSQLVLLNNLQRGDENIASTMLLTLFNRIMSNLYDDKMQVKFIPGEETDQKRINSLNILAQNDYREMGKAKLDYDWTWDTLFFGQGWMETMRFNKTRKILEPCVINPLVFGYDPYFENVQDWRYYWKWITKSKWQIEALIKDGTITGITSCSDIPSGIDSTLWDFKIKRDAAKKAVAMPMDTINDEAYQILEYYGYKDDGKKYVFWTDKSMSKILMEELLDFRDAPNGKDSLWPIVKKEAFREPHSSVVFSIADILEDKHRAKSVLLNLAFLAAKDKANPLYEYVPDNVNDVTAFFSRQIGQHISVKEIGKSVGPLNTSEPMSAGLSAFISMLTQEANDPVGTGMSLQPVKKGKTSATDSAIQQQLNDLAQSLQSKVMQFGEEDFWSHWYHRYRRFTKKGDTKVATITGVKGMTFEKIDLGDLHSKFPPGVQVFSAKEAEYKELVLRRDLQQMYPQFVETLGPDGMRNFNKYVFFPKLISDPSTVDLLIPNSLDEIKAEQENDTLAEGTLVDVKPTDNHEQHLYIHFMAKKTWATWAHIAWHEELLGMQKEQQMIAQQQQNSGMKDGASGVPTDKPGEAKKPKIGDNKKDPKEAAVPLKNEVKPQIAAKVK